MPAKGQLINVGLSVSRVGGKAQMKAMRKVSAPLRINLAQYRELAVFAQFGSDLDKATQEKLTQGEKLIEALKQSQYNTIPVEEQVVILFVSSGKYLMDIDTDDVREFNTKIVEYMKENYINILEKIRISGELSQENEKKLINIINEYKKIYLEKKEQK